MQEGDAAAYVAAAFATTSVANTDGSSADRSDAASPSPACAVFCFSGGMISTPVTRGTRRHARCVRRGAARSVEGLLGVRLIATTAANKQPPTGREKITNRGKYRVYNSKCPRFAVGGGEWLSRVSRNFVCRSLRASTRPRAWPRPTCDDRIPMSKTPVNDMFSATPAALAKMRTARNDLNLDTSPLLQTPPALRGGAADAASLAPAFADMMSASPAQLAKMRAASAASPLSNGHAQVHANGHANGAMGSPVSPLPRPRSRRCSADRPRTSPRCARRGRSRANEPPAATHSTASTAYGNTSYVASSPLVAPAGPDPLRRYVRRVPGAPELDALGPGGAGASPYGAAGGPRPVYRAASTTCSRRRPRT